MKLYLSGKGKEYPFEKKILQKIQNFYSNLCERDPLSPSEHTLNPFLNKYRIRQITIEYSKEKARERRRKISDIQASLKISEERCGSSPTPENQEEFELLIQSNRKPLGMKKEKKAISYF